MITTYIKEEFEALDFDTKCAILEELLTDDFFQGQVDIDFYFEEDEYNNLLPKPIKVAEREDKEFKILIERLTIKLFEENATIEIDIDKFFED